MVKILSLTLFYCDEIACLFIVNIDSKTLQVEKLAYKVIFKFLLDVLE